MNGDRSNKTQLTDAGMAYNPEWSPDGTKIVLLGYFWELGCLSDEQRWER